MRAYLGVDPGVSGGIAIVKAGAALAYPMPDTERDIWETVNELAKFADCEVIGAIELVHSSPQMGVKSAFTFGKSYGNLRMALIGASIPWREVRPQAWQKELGCLTAGDKNVSKAKAQQLFPTVKLTHKTADALLIAEWLRRQP